MAYKSYMDGIIFVEGALNGAEPIAQISYKKDAFYNQQLKNLNDVKRQLVEKARQVGANVIVDFKYGQKSTSALRSMLLSWDDNINWYAEGTAAVIDEASYRSIVKKLTQPDEDE